MKEIKHDELEKLEKYSRNYKDYEALKRLYLEAETFDLLLRRIKSYEELLKMPTIQSSYSDFQSFKELEAFIFDNKKWLSVINNVSAEDHHREFQLRNSLDNDDLKKIARKYEPDLNQPYLDKAISFFKKDPKNFPEILKTSKRWVENKEIFKKMNVVFENYKGYDQLYSDVNGRLQKYYETVEFTKRLPAPMKRIISQELADNNFTNVQRLQSAIQERIEYDRRADFYSLLNTTHTSYDKVYEALYSYNKIFNLFGCRFLAFFTPGSKVVYWSKSKLIICVKTFFASKTLGTDAWCLSRTRSNWNSYVGNKEDVKFYIVINTKDHRSQMIGLCLEDNHSRIVNAFNQENRSDEEYESRNRELIQALKRYNKTNFLMRYTIRILNMFFIDVCGFRRAD